jgi:hypothetical protein
MSCDKESMYTCLMIGGPWVLMQRWDLGKNSGLLTGNADLSHCPSPFDGKVHHILRFLLGVVPYP